MEQYTPKGWPVSSNHLGEVTEMKPVLEKEKYRPSERLKKNSNNFILARITRFGKQEGQALKTYEDGLKNARNFIPPGESWDLTAAISLIDYLKGLTLEYNKPHLAGIADGIWQIISQIEFDKEELIHGIGMC